MILQVLVAGQVLVDDGADAGASVREPHHSIQWTMLRSSYLNRYWTQYAITHGPMRESLLQKRFLHDLF